MSVVHTVVVVVKYFVVKSQKHDSTSQIFHFPDFSVCKVPSVSSHPTRTREAFIIESQAVAWRGSHVRGRTATCYGVFVVCSTVWSRRRLGWASQSSWSFPQGSLLQVISGINSSASQPLSYELLIMACFEFFILVMVLPTIRFGNN